MTAKEMWMKRYPGEVEKAEAERSAARIVETFVDLGALNSEDDCRRCAEKEAKYNWQNYDPYVTDEYGVPRFRSPGEVMSDIRYGKTTELVSAMQKRDTVAEPPTAYSVKPRPEYDYKLKDGTRIDVKSSERASRQHVLEYAGVVSEYPAGRDSRGKLVFKTVPAVQKVIPPEDDLPNE